MKLSGYPFYWWYVISGKRSRVRQTLKDYAVADLEEVRKDTRKRIEPNFPEMVERQDFAKVVVFLDKRFHQFSSEFVSVFQSGDFFYDWIIRLGVFIGDLVIQHSINEAEWTKGEDGLLTLRFDRSSGPFWWSPFEFAEERYFFGEPEDFFLSLDIFRKLKC